MNLDDHQTYEEFMKDIKRKRAIPKELRIKAPWNWREKTLKTCIKEGLIKISYKYPFLSIPGEPISPPTVREIEHFRQFIKQHRCNDFYLVPQDNIQI